MQHDILELLTPKSYYFHSCAVGRNYDMIQVQLCKAGFADEI